MCDKDKYIFRDGQREQQCATRATIGIGSTIMPLRGASILGSVNRSNFNLKKNAN